MSMSMLSGAAYALSALCAMSAGTSGSAGVRMSYLGRSTVKLVGSDGFVVYIDPYAAGDYSDKADLVLVTHGHFDHNAVSKVGLKPGAVVAAPKGAVSGTYRAVREGDSFSVGSVQVLCVPAYNKNHARTSTVGYVVTIDGVVVYHAADTSFIPEMADLAALRIDYALFPTDGQWNMDGAEATRCAEAVRPRFAVAIHSSPIGSYDEARAARLTYDKTLKIAPGQTVTLTGQSG